MPVYESQCERGHKADHYVSLAQNVGCETHLCEACRVEIGAWTSMAPVLSMGSGITYFRENSGQWIHNLGDQPIYVTSHEQHKRLMREHKVDWVTERRVQGRGGWI